MNVWMGSVSLAVTLTSLHAAPLPLSEFLSQVRVKHDGFAAAELNKTGAKLRSRSAELAFWPSLQTLSQYTLDDKDDLLTQLGNQGRLSLGASVTEQTPYGITAKATYSLQRIDYEGIDPLVRPERKFWEAKPNLELSGSLWRNFLGSEIRSQVEAARRAALGFSFAESYRSRLILAQAESAYWALSAARSSLEIQSDVLARAQELFQWAKSRVDLQLLDRADLLQAEALLKLRSLELSSAKSALRSSARVFNSLRGVDSDEVPEDLDHVESVSVSKPARTGIRDDVRAADEQRRASEAQTKLGAEQVTPAIDLFGNVGLNGVNAKSSTAISESFKTNQPAYGVGLKVNIPLQFGIMSDAHKGFEQEAMAARKTYERRVFEQESEWKDLEQKLQEAEERLKLAKLLEGVQKDRRGTERQRLNRARTTMFQVIQAELDFASAVLTRLRTQSEILQLVAQMRTFNGDAE